MEQHQSKKYIVRTAFGILVSIFLMVTAFNQSTAVAQESSVAGMSVSSESAMISPAAEMKPALSFIESGMHLYDSLQLDQLGLSRKVFELALKGMQKLKKSDRLQADILSIADFSQPSSNRRFYIIDLINGEVLFHTWVAHGRNSGAQQAYAFSNKSRSNKSSLGFYVTGDSYQGSNGYSLKLLGMERGFNDNALRRGIVLHGARYVDEEKISQAGYIGRSQGCPAVTLEESRPIIDAIKGGSCLFIYHPFPLYHKRSSLVR